MGYELEVLRFYDWLETNPVGASCIVLWHALLHTWQKAGCPNTFAVAISILESKTGLKRDAIYNARNKLKQVGRIDWVERKGNQSALYTFASFIPTQTNIYEFASVKATQYPTQTPTQYPTQYPTQTPTQNMLASAEPTQNQIASVITTQNQQPEQFVSVKPHISNSNNSNNNNDYKDTPITPTINNNVSEKPTQTATQEFASEKPTQEHNPFTYYEQHFGLLRFTVIDEIKDYLEQGLENELICLAIDRTFDNGKNAWSYTRGILDRCVMRKVYTIEEFTKKENQHKRQKDMNKEGGVKDASGNGKASRFAGIERKDGGTGEQI